MEEHEATVAQIASQVSHFHASQTPFRIYHGSTLSTRHSSRQKDRIVDVSKLNHVLQFNKKEKTVLVEPNVPMDALVTATLAEGLLPKVVMELPNITVGGGFAGTSGESSSFRYGLFDRSIKKIQIVLGNGDVVWASADDKSDLFFACAGSCGSLGVITLLEMELIDAKRFVNLDYVPVSSVEEAVEKLKFFEKEPSVDYIDGIMYSLQDGVIMVGYLSDQHHLGRVQTFDKASDPWFYMHAEDILRRMQKEIAAVSDGPRRQPSDGINGKSASLSDKVTYTESIPVQSYLFRYDRGVFWSGLRAFTYFLTPFNRITRYLLNSFMDSRTMIHALHRSGLSSQAIIQDLAVPYESARAFIDYTNIKTGLWPLWLCPVKSAPKDQWNFSMGKGIPPDTTVLDVGIWGMGPKNSSEFIILNRDFEAEVKRLGGMKCLYAHAYYTEEEFWDVYDERQYKETRRKYHAEGLPSVYEKVRVDLQDVVGEESERKQGQWKDWAWRKFWGIYPLGGLYGVASATKGLLVQSDYLLKK